MPRLRNERTGVVVSVAEAFAAALGSEWERIKEPARKQQAEPEDKPAPRRRARK